MIFSVKSGMNIILRAYTIIRTKGISRIFFVLLGACVCKKHKHWNPRVPKGTEGFF